MAIVATATITGKTKIIIITTYQRVILSIHAGRGRRFFLFFSTLVARTASAHRARLYFYCLFFVVLVTLPTRNVFFDLACHINTIIQSFSPPNSFLIRFSLGSRPPPPHALRVPSGKRYIVFGTFFSSFCRHNVYTRYNLHTTNNRVRFSLR